MQYFSTRGAGPVSLDEALRAGIAEDGGLFLAERLPTFESGGFRRSGIDAAGCRSPAAAVFRRLGTAGRVARYSRRDFRVSDSADAVAGQRATRRAAGALSRPDGGLQGRRRCVPCGLPVTSRERRSITVDDTGGNVRRYGWRGCGGIRCASRHARRRAVSGRTRVRTPGASAVLLERQRGVAEGAGLVRRLPGTGQGCDGRRRSSRQAHRFSSANSINIGRLLPQSTYYADASLRHFRRTGNKPGFIIPTGNLGNAFACIMAREMGLPIGPVILATNANRTIADYFETLEMAAARQPADTGFCHGCR